MKNKHYCFFRNIPYYNDDEKFMLAFEKMLDNEEEYEVGIEKMLTSYFYTFFEESVFTLKNGKDIFAVKDLKKLINISKNKLKRESSSSVIRFQNLWSCRRLREKEFRVSQKFFSNKVLKEIRCCNYLVDKADELSNEYIYVNVLFKELVREFELYSDNVSNFDFDTLIYLMEYVEDNIDNIEEEILPEIRYLYFGSYIRDPHTIQNKYIKELDDFLDKNIHII